MQISNPIWVFLKTSIPQFTVLRLIAYILKTNIKHQFHNKLVWIVLAITNLESIFISIDKISSSSRIDPNVQPLKYNRRIILLQIAMLFQYILLTRKFFTAIWGGNMGDIDGIHGLEAVDH